MKLSLAWIFDHIEADWKDQDINFIFSKFNSIVAEIEHINRYNVQLDQFYLARFEKKTETGFQLSIPELSQTINLPVRKDGSDMISARNKNPIFMVKKQAGIFSWASLKDFDVDKEGYLPAVDVNDYGLQGNWRNLFEKEDVILDVDNKSLTHRPDMWGIS